VQKNNTLQNYSFHVSLMTTLYVGATLVDSYPLGIEEHKVLGVCWRLSDDRFIFDVSAIT